MYAEDDEWLALLLAADERSALVGDWLIAPAERDSAVRAIEEAAGQEIGAHEDLIPGTKPFIRGLFSSREGALWVWRWPSNPNVGTQLDVFGPDGHFCGSVTSDLRLREPMQVTGSGVAAVVLDALDVPQVVRLDLSSIADSPRDTPCQAFGGS